MLRQVLHGEAELLDTEPFANDARHRQKGPLLRCQDNATAAIVKSQGYCVVDFSAALQRPAQYSRHTETHTPAQTHTKTTAECDRIGRFYSSEEAARRKKDGTEGEQKRSVSKKKKNTSERPDQRQQRKEKHVCRDEKKKIINSE